MRSSAAALLCAGWVVLIGCCQAYYVPGTYPQEFRIGDHLQAQVNSLTSFDTELPYDYYSMPFCKPPEGIQKIANSANPGTILEGIRIENSPYNFTMKVSQTGLLACGEEQGAYGPLTAQEVKVLKERIDEHYRINMILDNLPITVYDLLDKDTEFVRPGFELGFKNDGKYYINNHLVFNILVYKTHGEYTAARDSYAKTAALESLDARRLLSAAHRRHLSSAAAAAVGAAGADAAAADGAATVSPFRVRLGKHHHRLARRGLREDAQEEYPSDLEYEDMNPDYFDLGEFEDPPFYMVVGFEVAPCSIFREKGKEVEDKSCGMDNNLHIPPMEIKEGAHIVYTYDVWFLDSDIKWASRWDAYLRMPGGKVHWFSILNSLLVTLVMATIVAMILVRTVRRDLAKYEQLMVDGSVDMKDEAGWKLVAGDVFRPPPSAAMLAVQVGTGVQILMAGSTTLILAALGFLSPAARGALVTCGMIFFVLLAGVSGFVAVYIWGMIERSYNNWQGVAARVAVYYPGINMLIFTLLNMVIVHTGSTGAVPVAMYFSIVAVWFLVSIPLTFLGGMLAVRIPILDWPVKTNQIPRHVPPAPLAANPILLFLAAGILPFGTMFIELYFAMTSIWLGYFYYLFGFVLLIGVLTCTINAEISLLCTYVQLCAEDYQWWWQSFRRGGSVAFYVSLYALGFMLANMGATFTFMSFFIYLSYMVIFTLAFYFSMGTLGFLSSLWFVYKIFRAVKAD